MATGGPAAAPRLRGRPRPARRPPPRLPGRRVSPAWVAVLLLPLPAAGQWHGEVALENRLYPAASPAHEPSLVVDLERTLRLPGRGGRVVVRPWLRLDPTGSGRSRADLRELSWALFSDRWEVRAGLREVFWGVTESRHVVDVLNQRELVAGGTGFVKLGQPMVSGAAFGPWGAAELHLVPWFRERPFEGRDGRLWSPLPVAGGAAVRGPGAGGPGPDWAVRWSRRSGPLELGATYFRGTDRDPTFHRDRVAGEAALVPRYGVVGQASVDAQWTGGPWLVKLEAMTRDPEGGRFVAAAGGVEYAFAPHLSVFLEYAHDGRGRAATTSLQDDAYLGARLLLQDGQLGAGVHLDRRSGNALLAASGERRLGAGASLRVELTGFLGAAGLEPPHAPRRHTSAIVSARYHF